TWCRAQALPSKARAHNIRYTGGRVACVGEPSVLRSVMLFGVAVPRSAAASVPGFGNPQAQCASADAPFKAHTSAVEFPSPGSTRIGCCYIRSIVSRGAMHAGKIWVWERPVIPGEQVDAVTGAPTTGPSLTHRRMTRSWRVT